MKTKKTKKEDTELLVTSFKISKDTHTRIKIAKCQLGIKNLDMLFKYLLELLPKK